MPIKKEVIIGDARLLLGDCEQILPMLGNFDLVCTDPPYGFLSGSSGKGSGKLKTRTLNIANKEWDVLPSADLISKVIAAGNDAILWGGNYFSLPPCRGLLIWDKQQPWLNFSAAEIAWTTLNRPVAMFRLSSSLGDKGEGNKHPTVKPLELMIWCLNFFPQAQSVIDPYMGSGTTGVAAIQLGRKFTGIEMNEKYFEIAVERIKQAHAQGKLFAPEPIIQKQESLLDDA